MQSIDSVMHVTANKSATLCALAMFYNPSLFSQSVSLALPMYYTGETDSVPSPNNICAIRVRRICM